MARTNTPWSSEDIPVPEKIPVTLIVNGVDTQLKLAPWTTCSVRCATIST